MTDKAKSVSLFGGEHFWPNFLDPFRQFGTAIANLFTPSAEAVDTNDAYEITIELPGVKENDIDVSIEGNMLRVKGEKRAEHEEKKENYYFSERHYGAFQRNFRLPENVDHAAIKASFKDGILTLKLPKSEKETPNSRKIDVKAG